MKTGKVIWFDDRKGIGFIRPDDHSQDIFVHQTDIDMPGHRVLYQDEIVSFEIDANNPHHRKAKAIKVKIIEGELK